MARRKSTKKPGSRVAHPTSKIAAPASHGPGELVIITGMSGSGKASVLKAFEDLGYYCVDNLPVGLIPRFAELVGQSSEIERTALVVDVREGAQLGELPDPAVPVLSVLLVAIGALVFANLDAALPGWDAAHTPAALALRAE